VEPGLVVGIGILALVLLGLIRMAWRIVRGNEELEAGGSMGTQFFGRSRHKSPADID
jgi:hypothetical protein